MNAADEVAVDLFLKDEIGFLDIPGVIGETMARHTARPEPTLDEIYAVDAEARRTATQLATRSLSVGY